MSYFLSQYLRAAMILVGCYLGVYLIAFLLARLGREGVPVIYRCRRAWGIAFVVHLLAVVIFGASWWMTYHSTKFTDEWIYFPWFIAMFLVDLVLILAALVPIKKYSSYHS